MNLKYKDGIIEGLKTFDSFSAYADYITVYSAITLNNDIETDKKRDNYYRYIECINASFIKSALTGKYADHFGLGNEVKEHFVKGQELELCFKYASDKNFKEYFYVGDVPEVKPAIKSIIDYIYDNKMDFDIDGFQIATEIFNYGKGSYKEETVKKHLFEGQDYYLFKVENESKSVINYSEYLNCISLNLEISEKYKNYDKYNSIIILSDKLKALIDTLYVNEQNKNIVIIDYKTTSYNLLDFRNQYLKYQYDIQAEFYRTLVASLFPTYNVEFIFYVYEKNLGNFMPFFYNSNKEQSEEIWTKQSELGVSMKTLVEGDGYPAIFNSHSNKIYV